MIEMLFSLRFQSQLRRTRPELFTFVEHAIVNAVTNCGGKVGFEKRYISASFEGLTIGFWLDIFLILETILKTMEDAAPELYGYRCVMGKDIGDNRFSMLRALPLGIPGFWCDPLIQTELSPYVLFEQGLNGPETKPIIKGFARIQRIRLPNGVSWSFPCREQVQRILQEGAYKNALLLGPRFTGKREGLRRYCAAILRDVPPLEIRFGSGGRGLCCFADAYGSAPIHSMLLKLGGEALVKELDALEAALFRERLRVQYSPSLAQKARCFLALLLDSYAGICSRLGTKPVIIMENIHEAEDEAAQLFASVWHRSRTKNFYRVYGTCAAPEDTGNGEGRRFEVTGNNSWGKVFSRIIRFSVEDDYPERIPDIPQDLWEMAYNICLLRRYFPPAYFPELFEAEGKNSLSLSRALDIFNLMGLNDFTDDPLPRIAGCVSLAEKMLEERKEPIRAMVRNRLLAWVGEGRVKPCFNLLEALSELGGEASLITIQDALVEDIVNGTYAGIERALAEGSFGTIVGETRSAPLRYIFTTLKALSHGGETEIRDAFAEDAPNSDAFPSYKAQILANLTGFYFGIQDIPMATEKVKEAMMINQGRHGGKGLAQSYRLFSLANLFRQRIGDALEYFTFAVEHAGASEDYHELAVTTYYSAAVHFLFGNISQAERLAGQAEQTASVYSGAGWADRARFLRGRLRFETGHYREALDIFEGLQKQGSFFTSSAAGQAQTLAAWIYRCDVYLRNSKLRKPDPMNEDALLFQIEAAYLFADYKRTVKLADEFQSVLAGSDFLLIEQPDWRSGFSQCELLLFSRREFILRFLSAYRALALCQLGCSQPDAYEQAVGSMRRIIKEEGLPDTEPNEAFYLYAYYQVLQESGAVEVDMNTAISMAFKRLQRRASRIDDLETKRAFLSLNHWNKSLVDTAKRYKLI
ncbi:MAG: hypothetical protein LBG76_07230 [Treponema sp.]|jgi:hypothetical protein|nr:hypothetical protein [Treponema sp.]